MRLIIEQPIISDKIEILSESKVGQFDTVKFNALLMEADTKNQNRRIYPRDILHEAIEYQVRPKMQERNFGGELDHPLPTGSQTDILRQQTLSYKEMSHIITDMWWDGNKVYGTVETTPTPNGQILANLVRFGVKVGFSLRALGEVRPQSDGTNIVTRPFMLVAIDAVQNPSFERAKITEPLNESLLLESVVNHITETGKKYCENDVCFATLEQLVEWKLLQRLQ